MRVVVVGGGVIGLAAAWKLAVEGDEVTVVDPAPGRGASWVAGGMLAPVAEAYQGEQDITRLGVAASAGWRAWSRALRADSGIDPGYTERGTLVIARDADERTLIQPFHELQVAEGLASQTVSSREARRIEPALSPATRGGLWLADDHQVDNRAYLAALVEAGRRRGVELAAETALRVTPGAVDTAGGRLEADQVVVATGAWAIEVLDGDGAPIEIPIRPVKGQILRLRATTTGVFPSRTVRGLDAYIVPRSGGEIVVGATTEERGFDTTVTAGGVRTLLDAAYELVPGLDEAELVETAAGLRPGTPDNAPVIDRPADGITLAMGHYRHGVLFSPVTAAAVVGLVHAGPVPPEVAPFSADRFSGVRP